MWDCPRNLLRKRRLYWRFQPSTRTWVPPKPQPTPDTGAVAERLRNRPRGRFHLVEDARRDLRPESPTRSLGRVLRLALSPPAAQEPAFVVEHLRARAQPAPHQSPRGQQPDMVAGGVRRRRPALVPCIQPLLGGLV